MTTRFQQMTRLPDSLLVGWALATCLVTGSVHAERTLYADKTPAEMVEAGIIERLNEVVPLDLSFVDEHGDPVVLSQYFNGENPVILTLNYYQCPMLCSLTLNGLVAGLNDIDWSAGGEFDILTVSFNPDEGPGLAAAKKKAYLTEYKRDSASEGWHFLTGQEPAIEALTQSVGFGYQKDERTGEYAHTSTIIFLTPDGRVSRYMNDVVFAGRDLRLALVEASEGKIGSPLDQLLLMFCYHYDPEAGSYAMSAWKLMRLGALLTVFSIVIVLFALWRIGPKRRAAEPVLKHPTGPVWSEPS